MNRIKKYRYETACQWVGGQSGTLRCGDKPELQISTPAEFKGDPRLWSPEELVVSAVEACLMSTFLALAEARHLPVAFYSSTAEGWLERVDGVFQITRIIVRPTVVLRPGYPAEETFVMLRRAREQCMISNSLSAEVWLEPAVETFAEKPSVATGNQTHRDA